MSLKETGQGGGLEQRHIRVEQQHRAAAAFQRRFGLSQRVARAARRRLHDELERLAMRQRRAHVVGRLTDDQSGGGGGQPVRGAQDVLDHRQAAERMQHLWPRGLHPCALAGGEHNEVEMGRH